MDSNVNSFLIARHIQDRIEEATAARTVRAVKLARQGEPKLVHVRRLLGRRVTAETAAPATLAPLPPS